MFAYLETYLYLCTGYKSIMYGDIPTLIIGRSERFPP